MTRKVRKFVSRDFARTVDLDLFHRFLEPHLGEIGLDWAALPDADSKKRDAIFEFFRTADSDFPDELQRALHCASILSTDAGSRILLGQADARGIVLMPPDDDAEGGSKKITTRHLAMTAYLEQEALFYRAVDIASLWSAATPLERSGVREGVESRHQDEAACAAFKKEASEYFVSRYNGRFCDVRWYPDDDEIGILVLHGKNERAANVDDEGKERTLNFREIAEDSIRYHPASGRIKIGAAVEKDALKLLELFAKHLIGEPDFFRNAGADDLYTLTPINRDGTAFKFRWGWDENVAKVVVREIQIDEGEHEVDGRTRYSPWAMPVRDNANAITRLNELADGVTFADLRIVYVKLEFQFIAHGRKSRTTVKVKPPNIASFRDHSFEATIMEHLKRNGLRR